MKAVIIGSDALIDHLQGLAQAREEISRCDPSQFSVISWMEVMSGAADDRERQAAANLFA